MSEQNHGEASPSRRRLLKAGVATTGAAYIAPQILNTAVAGAQTTTCYGFKIGNGTLNPNGPSDPSCNTPFNNELAAAFPSGATVNLNQAAGQALVSVTSGGLNQLNATIEVTSANCVFSFVGFKAANPCYTDSHPSVTISNGGKTATIVSPPRQRPNGTTRPPAEISHITLVVCCTGSPPAP